MVDNVEFSVRENRIVVRMPKRRIFMEVRRAEVFADKRTKRERTRNTQLRKAISEYDM